MPIELTGEYTTARVMVDDERLVEEDAIAQIQELIDHPAFTEPVCVMADTHPGAGAPIGFSMPLGERVVPNVVGVDIGCFTGENEVPLLDGEDYRMDELAERDEPFCVYACEEDGAVTIGRATARKTRKDAELIEVRLDNGESIRCTPDHEFMLRDGSYRDARTLSPGDSLMPLYRGETEEGYRLVSHNRPGHVFERSVREHWLVARSEVMDIPKNVDSPVIHHENFDEGDNRPKNLVFKTASEHAKLHRSIVERNEHWQSEEFERRRIQALGEREPTEREIEAATENITRWMKENPEEFAESIEDNGERGAKYLRDFNSSERDCEICGEIRENPAAEYWHQVKEHPEETDYKLSPNAQSALENHEVESVKPLDEREDVYCLTVPKYHNFALSAGVFVHNCGMGATNLGGELPLPDANAERERRVRDVVPMGRNVHEYDDAPHLVDEFPFDRTNELFERFDAAYRDRFGEPIDPLEFDFEGYDEGYFKSLCDRVLARQRQGIGHVIRSAGTLGGGNHFVEFARGRESGEYWLIVHSGSRYLGKAVAEHWQKRANDYRAADAIRDAIPAEYVEYLKFDPDETSDADLFRWVTGGMGESHVRKERIREEFDGPEIDTVFDALSTLGPTGERNSALDWLEGREAHGYYVDMLFAQQYARWNRELMSDAICETLEVEPVETFQSTHNFIDFRDLTIRKGATPAREGQRLVVPFNMADGSILARGRGNERHHSTAPHGAGRVMSRSEAFETLSLSAFGEAMEGIYSESTVESVLDEAPMAYKPAGAIAEAIEPTAEVVEWLDVVHNLKAME